MRIHYNSKDLKHKQPFGALRQGEECKITIEIPTHCLTTQVFICMESYDKSFEYQIPLNFVSSADNYETYTGLFSLNICAVYHYYFKIHTQNSNFLLFKEGSTQTNIAVGDKWQITCYPKDLSVDEHFKGCIYYQIFPDRFYKYGECDLSGKLEPYHIHQNLNDTPVFLPDHNNIVQNNDFFGGNLNGIIHTLPYLKSLNVTTIYLNPIFYAYSNHRYDTADYKRIDPMLGTTDDFVNLCENAHELGMKIILDGVFSHTGSNSVYFDIHNIFPDGAYHNANSPYKNWFTFNEKHEYVSWWGINTLPCTNEMNEDFINFIINDEDSVIAHWLRLGADGYRLDVADELPDEFIQMLHTRCKEIKPNSIVIGEVWEDASIKESYGKLRSYFTELELDSTMNYPFKNAIIELLNGYITPDEFANSVMSICENYPKEVLDSLMNMLSTHDTARILTALGTKTVNIPKTEQSHTQLSDIERIEAVHKMQTAVFLQFILPGSPCIYYGDEAGLEGYGDPFNRRFFPWDNINLEVLAFYKNLTEIKTNYPSLRFGNIQISVVDSVIKIERCHENEQLTAIVNMGENYTFETNKKIISGASYSANDKIINVNKFGFILLK